MKITRFLSSLFLFCLLLLWTSSAPAQIPLQPTDAFINGIVRPSTTLPGQFTPLTGPYTLSTIIGSASGAILPINLAGGPTIVTGILPAANVANLPNTQITGLGTMSTQNANAVAISGGEADFLVYAGADSYLPTAMQALAVDVTKTLNTLTVTSGTAGGTANTLTFNGTPAAQGQLYQLLINNTDSAVHTITVPASYSFNKGTTTTTFLIQPNATQWLWWSYVGTTYYVWGDPTSVNDLTLKSVPTTADAVGIYDAASGVMKQATLGTLPSAHAITFTVNGNGTGIITGVKTAYVKTPYGGTLIGWTLVASPSGSVTVDIIRQATGSGLPGSGNSIIGGSGVKPATASAVENSSKSFTGWTSTTITALDNLSINVTAADGTVTYLNLVLYYE